MINKLDLNHSIDAYDTNRKVNELVDELNKLNATHYEGPMIHYDIAEKPTETPPEEKEISFKYGIMLGKDKAYAIEGDLDQAKQDIIADYKKRLVEKLKQNYWIDDDGKNIRLELAIIIVKETE